MILVVAVCVNNCPAVRNISLKYRLRYLMLDRWKIVAGILRLNSSILWFIFFIFGCRYVAWFPAKLRLCFFKCWCCVLCQSPRRQLQLVSSGNFSSSYLADGDVVGFIRNKASFHPSCAVPVRYYSHLWTYFLLPTRCELVVSADCPQMNCYANPGFFSVSSAPFWYPLSPRDVLQGFRALLKWWGQRLLLPYGCFSREELDFQIPSSSFALWEGATGADVFFKN